MFQSQHHDDNHTVSCGRNDMRDVERGDVDECFNCMHAAIVINKSCSDDGRRLITLSCFIGKTKGAKRSGLCRFRMPFDPVSETQCHVEIEDGDGMVDDRLVQPKITFSVKRFRFFATQ